MTPKENLLRTIWQNNPGWVPNNLENVVWIFSPVVERSYEIGYDDFGCHWSLEQGAEGGTYPTPGKPVITDLSNWKSQLKIPDLAAIDWEPIHRKVAEVDRKKFLIQGFVEMGLFERSYMLLGMEEALMAYIDQPKLMAELIAEIAAYKIRLIQKFNAEIKPDMIWYGDDWGTQDNLFLPPGIWRKIIKPHTQRIYNCMKENDIIINQHSCGKIEAIFEDLVEMGANIWNPCQPTNDLAKLKKTFGKKITFCGGIDSQFVLGRKDVTPGEVRAEVRKRIDQLAANGGYIAAPSHDVPYRQELLDAMNDEIENYGRFFYQKQSG